MVTAILLSGGIGTRLSSDVPKQYIRIGGRMIITYSLEILIRHPMIDGICIVAEREWYERILCELEALGIPVDKLRGCAQPGQTRQGSIVNGLEYLIMSRSEGAEYVSPSDQVIIHDAARPVLAEAQISACLNALKEHEGAMPVLPMKDTIYMSEDGSRVSSLVDRNKFYAGQAPEAFHLKRYYLANGKLLAQGELNRINGSTEPAILAGMDVAMIPGDENNFKITTAEDLERFRKLIEKDSMQSSFSGQSGVYYE